MESAAGFLIGVAWLLGIAFNLWWLWRTVCFMRRVEDTLASLDYHARSASEDRDRKRRG